MACNPETPQGKTSCVLPKFATQKENHLVSAPCDVGIGVGGTTSGQFGVRPNDRPAGSHDLGINTECAVHGEPGGLGAGRPAQMQGAPVGAGRGRRGAAPSAMTVRRGDQPVQSPALRKCLRMT